MDSAEEMETDFTFLNVLVNAKETVLESGAVVAL